jgi:hypothetical protein
VHLSLLTAILLSLGAPTASPSPAPIPDGEALIRAMHDRYAGKWYKTLTFVQTTTLTQPTPHTETWYESARIPGILRIDIPPADSDNAIFFKNDSVFRVAGGKLLRSRSFVHPLMVLGFDVYADPVEKTIARLKGLGFDLTKIRETTWQGRKAYVVGGAEGDTTASQFWVDRERLVFVRMLEPARDGKGGLEETQFNRYQPLGKGWIAVEVEFTVRGELLQKEEYADVKGDVQLPEGIFDPVNYQKATWRK